MIASAPDIQLLGPPTNRFRNADVVTAVEVISSADPQPTAAILTVSPAPNERNVPVDNQSNKSQVEFPESAEWTPRLRDRFAKLAKMKAIGRLALNQRIEFEKLSALRRRNYPRSGEEIIAEYEQRVLTRGLVQAFTNYVEFHKKHASHR
jgi:hypothetical protein